MMYNKLYIPVLILFSILSISSASAMSYLYPTDINSCKTINNPGSYNLLRDLTTNDSCLTILSNNVILDCHGHSIKSTNLGALYGVSIEGSNVTIKNCKIQNFTFGIYAHGIFTPTRNINILNNNITYSRDYGIHLTVAKSVYIYNNSISNYHTDGGDCIVVRTCSEEYVNITNNQFANSAYGISIEGSSHVKAINNNFNNLSYPLHVANGFDVNISKNKVSNCVYGLYLWESSNVRIYTNTFYNNSFSISLVSSRLNYIYNNNFLDKENLGEINSDTNYLNVTKSRGMNIVGGYYLAGNFWGKMNGQGFSQTCQDNNNDYLCDTKFILGDNNNDYLPLKKAIFKVD